MLRSCFLALCMLLLPAAPAVAQDARDAPLLDLVEVSLLGRDLVAFVASGGEVRERLHLGERVHWSDSRGALGVVITDQRMLAVGAGSASWQEARYERGEAPPGAAQLGERVALLTTNHRALGFNADRGALLEYRFGPRETFHASGVGEQVGVVVTNRSALGLSPLRDRFQSQDLQLHEQVELVDARSALATVRTSRRLLVFRGRTGAWSERRREIHERRGTSADVPRRKSRRQKPGSSGSGWSQPSAPTTAW